MRFVEFQTLGDMIAKGQFKDLFKKSDKPAPSSSPPGMPLDKIEVTDINGRQREGYVHRGVDLKAAVGTPVKATVDGKVTFAGDTHDGGLTVIIDTGKGRNDRLCHLSRINVRQGATVKVGEVVALSGATGHKITGPHLHWQVTVGGRNVDPLAGQQWAWAPGFGPDSGGAARKK